MWDLYLCVWIQFDEKWIPQNKYSSSPSCQNWKNKNQLYFLILLVVYFLFRGEKVILGTCAGLEPTTLRSREDTIPTELLFYATLGEILLEFYLFMHCQTLAFTHTTFSSL